MAKPVDHKPHSTNHMPPTAPSSIIYLNKPLVFVLMDGLYFVIPAYNEQRSIGQVISNLKNAGYTNFVVVDDGSTDNTSRIAKKTGAIVLHHIVNRGQGAALQTGIKYALFQGAQYIVTFDSDNQHRVEDLPNMLRQVIEGRADITLGSRFLRTEYAKSVPFVRRVLLKGSLLIQFLFYGIRLTDVHNGYRVMSRKAAQKIEITCDRMAHASEIVEEIMKKNLKFKEIPVKINYNVRRGNG